MSTNGYEAKRNLIAAIKARSLLDGNPLSGRQVEYAWPGQAAEDVCVYGGNVSFDHPAEDDVQDGLNVLEKEIAYITLVFHAAISPASDGGIRDTDELVEDMGDEVGRLVAENRRLCGGNSRARVESGSGSYNPGDRGPGSEMVYRIAVESYIE